jgi:hypothetical protein
MEQPKRSRGRPPAPPEEKLEQRSIRLTAAQWNKVDAGGGVPWLRDLIDRADPTARAAPDVGR